MDRGGYDAFTYVISKALNLSQDGLHEIVLDVFDPTETADGVPLGKQRAHVSILLHSRMNLNAAELLLMECAISMLTNTHPHQNDVNRHMQSAVVLRHALIPEMRPAYSNLDLESVYAVTSGGHHLHCNLRHLAGQCIAITAVHSCL